jgi:hypothetical protein
VVGLVYPCRTADQAAHLVLAGSSLVNSRVARAVAACRVSRTGAGSRKGTSRNSSTGARAPSGTACAGWDSYDGVVVERLLDPLSVGTV